MPLDWLFSQPWFFLAWVLAIILSLTLHEFFHAWSALWFGDDTAKNQGRLSLNPLVHVDWVGFLMLMIAGFGWAKPVPINPYNFSRPKLGQIVVSLAGPAANLFLILMAGIALKILMPQLSSANLLINFLFMTVLINVVLMLFNLVPLPPLDGSKVLFAILPARFNDFKEKLEANGPWILLLLVMADSFLNLGIFSAMFGWVFNLIWRFF